ncbi:Cytochrome P450 [Streptacidiphilus jiangxiensis]|uniref:Cytochrome P450 n=1 Tax=Streptacidiphilus jiangxiensis TaxID=235985 RepID=A0A1H7P3N0_STRJI|nr:Cytochrome P450 [Streptacidiphilus jiangxiensis]
MAGVVEPEPVGYPATARGCPFDPSPVYREAARAGPVSPVTRWDGSQAWLVTGLAEIRTVLQDNESFSSDPGRPGFPFVSADLREFLTSGAMSFLFMDDPGHARLRGMVAGDFTARRVKAMRPRIERIVAEALDEMVAQGAPADLIASFALVVPSRVICELLGVPYGDRAFFQRQTDIMCSNLSGPEQSGAAMMALSHYMAGIIGQGMHESDDSLLGRLAARVTRGELTTVEATAMSMLLMLAGYETTAGAIGLGVLALLQHPRQLALLKADPALAKGAVEELLRYVGVSQVGSLRVAVADTLVGGTLLAAGQGVICMLPVADRDEELFPDADRLDITRPPGQNLAFSYGVHHCLGAELARAELQIALPALLRRLPALRLAVPADQIRYKYEGDLYGLHELPVAW